MACLFHKWDGCKCAKCGAVREEQHKFTPVPGECLTRCERCGKEIKRHQWAEGDALRICPVCGKGEIYLRDFFNEEELVCIFAASMNCREKKDEADLDGIDVYNAVYAFSSRTYISAALFAELIGIIEGPMFAQTLPEYAPNADKAQIRASVIAKGQELQARLTNEKFCQ